MRETHFIEVDLIGNENKMSYNFVEEENQGTIQVKWFERVFRLLVIVVLEVVVLYRVHLCFNYTRY